MSHYSVAVFTDGNTDLDDLLAPYDESLMVAKYVSLKKKDIINLGRENIKYLMQLYKIINL